VTRSISSSTLTFSRELAIVHTARPAPSTVSKTASATARRAHARLQADGRLGDDAERALGADEEREQVVPRPALERAAPKAHDLARAQHDLDAEHALARDPLAHAAQPPGVRREVPADRADLEARGIGRKGEAVGLGGALERAVQHARLHHRDAVARADLEDLVHLHEREHQAAICRDRAARDSAARAARDHGDAVLRRDA